MLTRIVVIAAAVRSGTSTFPPTAVPVGVSAITVAVDRTLATDPALRADWALELSLTGNNGPWIPWGGAGTVGGPVIGGKNNQLLAESNFSTTLVRRLGDGSIEPGFEPSNVNRRIRGSLVLNQPVTTSIAVTLDDAPVPAIVAVPPPHQSVAFDNTAVFTVVGGTSNTTPAFIITSNANRAGLLGLSMRQNGATNIVGSIGGTNGALVTGTDSGTAASIRTIIYGVTAPPSGSQTANMNWTSAMDTTLGVVTADGVDQTTPFNNGTTGTGTNPISLSITSTATGMSCAVAVVSADVLSAATQTEKWNQTATAFGAGSINQGGGTVTHSWTSSGGESKTISGANFQAVVASTGNIAWIKA